MKLIIGIVVALIITGFGIQSSEPLSPDLNGKPLILSLITDKDKNYYFELYQKNESYKREAHREYQAIVQQRKERLRAISGYMTAQEKQSQKEYANKLIAEADKAKEAYYRYGKNMKEIERILNSLGYKLK